MHAVRVGAWVIHYFAAQVLIMVIGVGPVAWRAIRPMEVSCFWAVPLRFHFHSPLPPLLTGSSPDGDGCEQKPTNHAHAKPRVIMRARRARDGNWDEADDDFASSAAATTTGASAASTRELKTRRARQIIHFVQPLCECGLLAKSSTWICTQQMPQQQVPNLASKAAHTLR